MSVVPRIKRRQINGIESLVLGDVVIAADAVIGSGVRFGHHVVVHPGTVIGDDVTVGDHAVLGRPPRPGKASSVRIDAILPPLRIAAGTIIGTGAVIAAGTTIGHESMIADQAFVRERVRIGDRTVIGRGVAVENDTTIGDDTRIQTGAYITAYVTIESQVFIAPCVVTTNDNSMARAADVHAITRGATIRRGARVGANSTLLPRIEIGEDAFVAAGSVVTRDVPPRVVVMGIPARLVRAVPSAEWLV